MLDYNTVPPQTVVQSQVRGGGVHSTGKHQQRRSDLGETWF